MRLLLDIITIDRVCGIIIICSSTKHRQTLALYELVIIWKAKVCLSYIFANFLRLILNWEWIIDYYPLILILF